jgi:GH43 family beta-xylosidase
MAGRARLYFQGARAGKGAVKEGMFYMRMPVATIATVGPLTGRSVSRRRLVCLPMLPSSSAINELHKEKKQVDLSK